MNSSFGVVFFSSMGHARNPDTWISMAIPSIKNLLYIPNLFSFWDKFLLFLEVKAITWILLYRTLFWYQVSRLTIRHSLKKAGIKQRQFVIMAPLTTSRLGSTYRTREAIPKTCKVSIVHTNTKSKRKGRLHDLKKQMRSERNTVLSSGTQNAKNRHQVHATCSSVGIRATNCLSRPEKIRSQSVEIFVRYEWMRAATYLPRSLLQ